MRIHHLSFTVLTGACLVGAASPAADAALYSDGTFVGGSINIDGNASDWTSDMIVVTDPNELPEGTQNPDGGIRDQADIRNVYFANDETTLYGRHDIYWEQATTSSGGNANSRAVYYVFDVDNDRTTGWTYDRGFASGTISDGNEVEIRMRLGDDDHPLVDQFYRDDDPTIGAPQEQVDSSLTLAAIVDTSGPGREWSVSLADLGIPNEPGTYTVSWYAFSRFDGDLVPGESWNDPEPTFATVDVTVVPEPATLSLAGLGAGLLLLRRRRRA